MTSSYHILVGVAPLTPGLVANELNVIPNQGLGMTIVTQPELTMFFVCINEGKLHWPSRARFTEKDAKQEAARITDVPINTHVLFGEVWARRHR